jgi:hypothetical protein
LESLQLIFGFWDLAREGLSLALVGRLSVILLSLFLLPGGGFVASGSAYHTQKKKDEKDQPVRLKTDLFELRAVVTDARGKLVDDLQKEDFELLENNRPQSVSFFSIKRIPDQRTSPPSSAKTPAANSPVRTIVLFVDTLHLTASDALQTRQALRYFVDHQMSDQDMVALVSSAGSLGLLGQFTRDRQLLRFAIDRLPPGISGRGTFFTPYLCSQIVLEVEEALTVGAQIVKAEEGVTASSPWLEPDLVVKSIGRQMAV